VVSDELNDNHNVRGRTLPDSQERVSRAAALQSAGPNTASIASWRKITISPHRAPQRKPQAHLVRSQPRTQLSNDLLRSPGDAAEPLGQPAEHTSGWPPFQPH
jgi:hypothetical protein